MKRLIDSSRNKVHVGSPADGLSSFSPSGGTLIQHLRPNVLAAASRPYPGGLLFRSGEAEGRCSVVVVARWQVVTKHKRENQTKRTPYFPTQLVSRNPIVRFSHHHKNTANMAKMMKLPTLSRYTYIFAALNVILLLTGILTLVTVLGWKHLLEQPIGSNPDIYTRLAVGNLVIYGGFIGSASTFLTVAISVWTFATKTTRDNAQTLPLRVYMSSLIITLFITLIAASLVWFSTLRERTLFTPVWSGLPVPQRIFIQNDLKCCGWFNATLSGLFEDPLMKADDVLNNTFTLSYGFTGVQFFLFITAAALANLRIQQKRFMRIDYKLRHGKGAFL
ncbi:hypothetical protein KEM48_006333 [Puccinia striiformis f. sp. tritici PST-130]|nr:hypothetical protein KEM48_006333 [Puccinia striiformis f. sp. tritici PST-130]